MKTTALRLYGKNDVRVESFELPPIQEDELLVKIVCDSLCMSSWKAAVKGEDHKRVPEDIATNPTVLGHEFCGEIIEVGAKWKEKYTAGDRFTIQPALMNTYDAIGYSFMNMGGDMTYGIVPDIYISDGNVIPYHGEAFFDGGLCEALSCVTGAVNATYHTTKGVYTHDMGIKKDGKAAVLAGAGPMGLALLDYLLGRDDKPSLLVCTDIDEDRLRRVEEVLSVSKAKELGVEFICVNTAKYEDPAAYLRGITGGEGYDDVFVFAPVAAVIEQGDAILGYDGCLNFFAGPEKEDFSASFNFYNVHYNATHIVGTSGGNTDDMIESLELAAAGRTNPAILITHIGGLDSTAEATLNMPEIGGGKKLIYNHISMPLTPIADFAKLGKDDPFFAKLAELVDADNGLWNVDAERWLLENGMEINGRDG